MPGQVCTDQDSNALYGLMHGGRNGGGMRRKQSQANREKHRHKSTQTIEDAERALAKTRRRIDAFGRSRTDQSSHNSPPERDSSTVPERIGMWSQPVHGRDRILLTAAQVAERLNVSVQRVYELARTGRLPSIRIGRQVRIDPVQLADWLRTGGTPQANKRSARASRFGRPSADHFQGPIDEVHHD